MLFKELFQDEVEDDQTIFRKMLNPDSMQTGTRHEEVIRYQNENVKKVKSTYYGAMYFRENSLNDIMLEVVRCGSGGRQTSVTLSSDTSQIGVKWESNAIYALLRPVSTRHDSIMSCFLTGLISWCG